MKENNFLSVILYCQNINKDSILSFPKALYNTFLKNFKNYEVIIVNDVASEKDIENFSTEISKYVEHNTTSIINFPSYVGIEPAMIAGDNLAIGDYILEIDNINVSFSESTFMNAYKKLMEGYDIVSIEPKSTKKSIASSLFYKLYNNGVASEQNIGFDVFRLVSRRAFNRAKASSKTIPYRKAIYASCGLKHLILKDESLIISFPKGEKPHIKNKIALGIDSLLIFTNTIQRLAITISCMFLLITIAITVYTVYIFISSNPVAGWTPIMLYLSIGFLGIFTMMAIVLRFLSVILDMVYKKDMHAIESIRKV